MRAWQAMWGERRIENRRELEGAAGEKKGGVERERERERKRARAREEKRECAKGRPVQCCTRERDNSREESRADETYLHFPDLLTLQLIVHRGRLSTKKEKEGECGNGKRKCACEQARKRGGNQRKKLENEKCAKEISCRVCLQKIAF